MAHPEVRFFLYPSKEFWEDANRIAETGQILSRAFENLTQRIERANAWRKSDPPKSNR